MGLGEIYALLTALVWAVAVLCFKRSGETVSPFALNLFRVSVSSGLLAVTLMILGPVSGTHVTLDNLLLLFVSGVVGIAVSDTLFHACLNLVGAGITGIIDCLYSPFILLLAWAFLGEDLSAGKLAGMALVIASVVIATARPGFNTPATGRRRLALGVLLGVLAMATVAAGLVIAKPVLDRAPLLWVVTVRQLSALAVILPVAALSRRRTEILAVFKPTRHWRASLLGTFLGSYLALMLWLAGTKATQVGISAILNQTSTVYLLILSSLVLKEPFTIRKVVATVCAMAGIAVVTLAH